jgi:hypothetical protein
VFFVHRAGLHILRRYLQRVGQKKRYCDFHDFLTLRNLVTVLPEFFSAPVSE